MKWISYRSPRGDRVGAVIDDTQVIDVGSLPGLSKLRGLSLRQLLADDLLGEVSAQLQPAEGTVPTETLADVVLLPPVLDSEKVICVGVNYQAHRDEAGVVERPEFPTLFTRFADTHVGHLAPVRHPAVTSQLDYEGEVALVIGRALLGGESDEELLAAIAGLSCYNDVSVRDWQLHTSQWTPGKNFRGVGSFGPWLVSLDEFDDLAAVRLTTRVNGEVRQDATLSELIFDFTAILRYVTSFTSLAPGDVVVTGTPSGVGLAMDPPQYLQPGDVMEVEVSGVGVLRNTVEAVEADEGGSRRGMS